MHPKLLGPPEGTPAENHFEDPWKRLHRQRPWKVALDLAARPSPLEASWTPEAPGKAAPPSP